MVITYSVNKDLYRVSDKVCDVSLVTTEYQHGSNLLVHIQLGEKLGTRLNNRLGDLLPEGVGIQNEQFLYKKMYCQGDPKLITRSTFDEKLSRFDKNQTVIEREMLLEYAYSDKNDKPDHVKIVITEKGNTTAAEIDFKDTEQYEGFLCPDWLVEAAMPA